MMTNQAQNRRERLARLKALRDCQNAEGAPERASSASFPTPGPKHAQHDTARRLLLECRLAVEDELHSVSVPVQLGEMRASQVHQSGQVTDCQSAHLSQFPVFGAEASAAPGNANNSVPQTSPVSLGNPLVDVPTVDAAVSTSTPQKFSFFTNPGQPSMPLKHAIAHRVHMQPSQTPGPTPPRTHTPTPPAGPPPRWHGAGGSRSGIGPPPASMRPPGPKPLPPGAGTQPGLQRPTFPFPLPPPGPVPPMQAPSRPDMHGHVGFVHENPYLSGRGPGGRGARGRGRGGGDRGGSNGNGGAAASGQASPDMWADPWVAFRGMYPKCK
jgi:hypothetical protein